jgi:VWFA-related protein
MKHGLLPLLALVLLAGATIGAQQPSAPFIQQPPATFRTDINVVEVHAVVTDERGQFVTDLSAEDFEIFEDGRRQSPSVFELVNLPVARSTAAPARADLEPDVRSSTRHFDGRVYIFVLDDLHTTALRSAQVRLAATRFIDEHLAPNDLAAIVYTSGRQDAAQELTGSRRLLKASVDKFQGQKLPSASAERLGVHFRERERESGASSGTDDGSSQSRQTATTGRLDDPLDSERGFNARRALEMVRDTAQFLADVKGRRKALVMFSEGIDYDIHDVFNNRSASSLVFDARDAIAAAQRANVAIYAVDPRGLTQLGDQSIEIASLSPDATVDYGTSRDFQRELLLAQESLMWLADETGGIALVRSNDINRGLRRIAEDNSRYYVLGYSSDQTKSPDKFRSIDVRVKHPGLKVRARHGYLPADPKAAARKRERELKAGTSPALAAALNNPLPIGELPVRVFAAPFRGAGKNGSVLLSIEVDGQAVPFDLRDDRFTNTMEFSIVAADHTGKVQDSDRQELNLKLKQDTRDRVASAGVRVLSRLDLPAGRYQIRVGVHESVGGAVATVPYDIEVPDYSKAAFTLSGLTVTSSAAGALMTPAPEARIKQVFPVPPAATRTFGRDERLGVFVELYDNATPAAHAVDFTTTVTSLDDLGPRFSAQDTRTIEAGAGVRTQEYRADVPLRDLAPGRYILRVEATSRVDERTVARQVLFEVRDTPRSMTY